MEQSAIEPTNIVQPKTEINSENYFDFPAINQSGLNKYLEDANLFWKNSPINPNREPQKEPTPAMVFGKLCHCLLLEESKFDEQFKIKPEDINRRTNVGKAEYEDFMLSVRGHDIITREQLEDARIMVGKVKRNLIASKTLSIGEPEKPLAWKDTFALDGFERAGTGLWCKTKIDQYRDGMTIDYKTTEDVRADVFARSIDAFGYHRQAAFNHMGIQQVYGEKPKGHILIVQSKRNPDTVVTYSLDPEDIYDGKGQCIMLLDSIHKRIQLDNWQTYDPNIIHNIKMSPWARTFTQDDIF